MTDTTSGADGDAAQPDQHLTVEDAGTTTDPADLVDGDDDASAPAGGGDLFSHVFDQTNGVVDGLDGDSDGSAESDILAGRVRDLESPMIEDAEVRSDDDGVHDLRDPNP